MGEMTQPNTAIQPPRAILLVKIISIFIILLGASYIIAGILVLFGVNFAFSAILNTFILAISLIGAGIITLIGVGIKVSIFNGIFFLVVGPLLFFVGIMLWKGKNWARNVVVVFSMLGIVGELWVIVFGILTQFLSMFVFLINFIPLIINGVIVWYLEYNKSVKETFSKK